jgi:protocatechuate 3,4-dioxygenase beta subunit
MTRVAVVLVAAATLVASAQSPGPFVHGRIVSAATSQPVRNARVRTEDAGTKPIATDADGRFVVPAGSTVVVAKAGFAPARVPAHDGIEIRLQRGAAISGRVFDEYGVPAPLITVVAQQIVATAATVPRKATTIAHVETDDTGAYRLFDLPAGDFVVAVAGPRTFNGASAAPVPRPVVDELLHNFYPRSRSRDEAAILHVAGGADLAGVNLTIELPGVPVLPREPSGPGASGGTIRGRVTTSDGTPARHARVELASRGRLFSPRNAPTDEDGQYEFVGIEPGDYLLSVIDTTFALTRYGGGSAADRGDAITLKTGAVVTADIVVARGCVISGRIVDDIGDPVENANIRVEQLRWAGGRMRLVRVPGIAGQHTNDTGRFRVFGLPPGKYVLNAVLGEDVEGWAVNDLPGFTRTFYPGTSRAAEAQLLEVAGGFDVLTADFALVRGRTSRVSGRAIGVGGEPLEGIVNLAPSARSRTLAANPFPLRVRTENGAFSFEGLAPGEYVIQAAAAQRERSHEAAFAAQFVSVDAADVDNIVIRVSNGSSVTGRIRFEEDAPASTDGFEVSSVVVDADLASLADDPTARAELADDWTFEMRGLNGPRVITVRTPVGWMLESVTAGGLDITDAAVPFGTMDQSLAAVDVTVTRRVTELRVNVMSRTGAPASDAAVIAFAVDRRRWLPGARFAGGGPAIGGAASIRALPAGEYYVVATRVRPGTDPRGEMSQFEYLESLVPSATRVTITPDQTRTISLRLP